MHGQTICEANDYCWRLKIFAVVSVCTERSVEPNVLVAWFRKTHTS